MSQFPYVAYVAAALRFSITGQRPTLVLVSLFLLMWLVVLASIRRVAVLEDTDEIANGWTTALSRNSADTIENLRRVSSSATMLSFGLAMFGPLLAAWAFLP